MSHSVLHHNFTSPIITDYHTYTSILVLNSDNYWRVTTSLDEKMRKSICNRLYSHNHNNEFCEELWLRNSERCSISPRSAYRSANRSTRRIRQHSLQMRRNLARFPASPIKRSSGIPSSLRRSRLFAIIRVHQPVPVRPYLPTLSQRSSPTFPPNRHSIPVLGFPYACFTDQGRRLHISRMDEYVKHPRHVKN